MPEDYPADVTPIDDGVEPPVTADYPWAQVPEALLYDADMSAQAIRLYAVLHRHGTTPTRCFPSHDRLGELTGVSGRSVQRPLAELVSKGWITRTKRFNKRGERTTDGYHVYADLRDTTAQKVPPVHRAESSEEREQEEVLNETHRGDRATNDGPPVAPTVAPCVDDLFDIAYAAYPVRNGRTRAREAWDVAVTIAAADVIIDAIRAYVTDPVRVAQGNRYTPSMAKWLEGRMWEQAPDVMAPPTPEEQTAAAAQRRYADDAARRAGTDCPRCHNYGFYDNDGLAVPCDPHLPAAANAPVVPLHAASADA